MLLVLCYVTTRRHHHPLRPRSRLRFPTSALLRHRPRRSDRMPPRPRARCPIRTPARSRSRATSSRNRRRIPSGSCTAGSPSSSRLSSQRGGSSGGTGLPSGGRSCASAGMGAAEWHAAPAGQSLHPVSLCSAFVPARRHRQQDAVQNALLVRGGHSWHCAPLCAGCRHLAQLRRHCSSPDGHSPQIALGCDACLHRPHGRARAASSATAALSPCRWASEERVANLLGSALHPPATAMRTLPGPSGVPRSRGTRMWAIDRLGTGRTCAH